MLTSLLTAYIASTIQPDLDLNYNQFNKVQNEQTISTASFGFENLSKKLQAPTKDPTKISPIIGAKGVMSIDRKSGAVLYEKNGHSRMPIASITKLMTATIILEENQFDEIVTVSDKANSTGGSTMNLHTGEQITVENALRGLLINSANDSAVALAEHNAGSVDKFVEKMNKRATELGLVNTHYSNPTGLDNPNNYSSPADVAKLANYIYNNKKIQEITNTQSIDVHSTDGQITHQLKNTNELLDSEILHVKGMKTGSTDGAGLCFVAVAEKEAGQEIITVVLNSPARFQETKVLIDWIFRSYNW